MKLYSVFKTAEGFAVRDWDGRKVIAFKGRGSKFKATFYCNEYNFERAMECLKNLNA